MGFLLNLLPFLGGVFNRASDSADLSEKNINAENVALRAAVQAESARTPSTWWDSLVDGINRLVRPLFTFGVLALFVWACVEPVSFSAAMTALQLIPENLWLIMGTIIVFWFGDRMLKLSSSGGKTVAQVSEVVNQIKQIQAIQAPQEAPTLSLAQQADSERRETEKPLSGQKISDAEYTRQMADEGTPLTLPAIEEWNRRRGLK